MRLGPSRVSRAGSDVDVDEHCGDVHRRGRQRRGGDGIRTKVLIAMALEVARELDHRRARPGDLEWGVDGLAAGRVHALSGPRRLEELEEPDRGELAELP